jgi:uncharacterized membrane protein
MKHVIALSLITVLALPLTLILTFILSPFWNWFETVSGIESMGHSGPANWCFVAMLLVVLSSSWGTWFIVGRRKY